MSVLGTLIIYKITPCYEEAALNYTCLMSSENQSELWQYQHQMSSANQTTISLKGRQVLMKTSKT